METISLTSIIPATNDKFTAMLVNAILTDNHEDAKMAQDVIKTRSAMQQSGLSGISDTKTVQSQVGGSKPITLGGRY